MSGRLGSDPINRFRALFGTPWRQSSRGALMVPAIRPREAEYESLSDGELKQKAASSAAGPAAASRSTSCCPKRSAWCASPRSGRSACGRSTCSSPPASSCSNGGLAELATGEGKTLTACFPVVPQRAGRQGRPRHHGQRLPGQARRRVDRPGLHDARAVRRVLAAEDGGRRSARPPTAGDITYGTASRVRLRLPARPAQAARRAGGDARRSGARGRPTAGSRRLDPRVQRDHSLRPGGRGRQHLHRRGPDAAHHRHPDPRGQARGVRRLPLGRRAGQADAARTSTSPTT